MGIDSTTYSYDDTINTGVLTSAEKVLRNQVIVISDDRFGQGSDKLGKVLLSSYIHTLMECEIYPKAILFLNAGVNIVVEGSNVLEYLRTMEANGVQILSCGACLDYYNLKDKLCVGGVTNMYTIVEIMNGASNTIKI